MSFLKKGFQDENLGCVVVPVQLLHAAVLVAVNAANSVHAVLGEVERPAVFALVLVYVNSEGCLSELMLAVGEATLLFVSTVTGLNPVFAHLVLVFSIGVSFSFFRCRRRGCWLAWVERGACLVRVETLLGKAAGLLRSLRRLEGGHFGLAVK